MTDFLSRANRIFATTGPSKTVWPKCPKCGSFIRGLPGTSCVICYARSLEKKEAA